MKITKIRKQTLMEKEVDEILTQMSTMDRTSKEYSDIADNLDRVCKAKSYESNRRISPDTIAIVAGNLLGILIILGYERADVITTKALGFVLKGRV